MTCFKSILIVATLFVTSVFTAPQLVERNANITDTQVLQLVLMAEYPLDAFYNQALERLDEKAFIDAGYEPWVRGRFEQISEHVQTHINFLTKVLGSDAPQPCTYDFPYNDPKSFVAFAVDLEASVSSAYMGVVQHLHNKDILRNVASILSVKSRHAAWTASAVFKVSPWDGSFGTPLPIDGIYSLSSQLIVSCPASNPELIVKPLPMLTTNPANPPAGGEDMEFIFDHDKVKHNGQLYVAWFDGISVRHTILRDDYKAYVPKDLMGMVYGAVVGSKETDPEKQKLLTGLAMFEFDFPSSVTNA